MLLEQYQHKDQDLIFNRNITLFHQELYKYDGKGLTTSINASLGGLVNFNLIEQQQQILYHKPVADGTFDNEKLCP